MTKRERYLKALRNEKVDKLVWAPNFDYWLYVNRAENTIPEKFKDMSRNDIVRAIGGYIWHRCGGFKTVLDNSVKLIHSKADGNFIDEYQTPIGSVRQVFLKTEGEHSSHFLSEHFVKGVEDLKILKYVIEATHYEPDYGPALKALRETGDDGIVLTQACCVPFIEFCKTDAGYMNGFYLWTDYPNEVESILNAYFENYLQAYRVLADCPVDVVSTGDNMDGTMISPDLFKRYAIPFYQEAKKILKNKIFQGHWCGRTQTLLPLVPGCGLDGVEAIVSKPMADVELSEAIDLLEGKVVLQGGIPAVLVCKEGGSFGKFEKYINDVILPLKGRKGFILGMSDNVPPNADFSRVQAIAKLIE